MKPLKPSMKENKRYLLIMGKNLKENVERAILDFLGVLGHSKASPKIIKSSGNKLVLSVNRESVNHVRAALTVWPEKITVERVSGTLNGLGKK